MKKWVKELDRILRGEATRMTSLRSGSIDISIAGLSVILVILGMLYGLCMGSFTVLRTWGTDLQSDGLRQLAATVVKVPALFFLTLLVTCPSLYVFNALLGSRLTVASVLRLLVAMLGVLLAVLASFGTIVAFFSFTTESYPFMVVLNVAVFAVSGFLGVAFLLQTLHRLTVTIHPAPSPRPAGSSHLSNLPPWSSTSLAGAMPPPLPGQAESSPTPEAPGIEEPAVPPVVEEPALGALQSLQALRPPAVSAVFKTWMLLFGLVGSQMGWVLRPFIGNPNLPFHLFRPRQSNFFAAVVKIVMHLFGQPVSW